MYNRDVTGSRHNRGETTIDKSNAGHLEEKWRFPAKDSAQEIGVIHATPVVVNGYVYFGTTTADPTFYKLTPDGRIRWSYRNPEFARAAAPSEPQPKDGEPRSRDFKCHPSEEQRSVRRWSPKAPSSTAIWMAGSTRWIVRPGKSVGS